MNQNNSERRLAENQVTFRRYNEKVQRGIDNYNEIAAEEGDPPLRIDNASTFHFYCECSDNDCRKRIKLTLGAYNMIHSLRDTFCLVAGHNIPEVEEIILVTNDFIIVQKRKYPNQEPQPLHDNDVQNV